MISLLYIYSTAFGQIICRIDVLVSLGIKQMYHYLVMVRRTHVDPQLEGHRHPVLL